MQDTCYDEQDGGTERLSLSLLTTNRRELSPDAWLQFDSKNQEFVGIPLEEEVTFDRIQSETEWKVFVQCIANTSSSRLTLMIFFFFTFYHLGRPNRISIGE